MNKTVAIIIGVALAFIVIVAAWLIAVTYFFVAPEIEESVQAARARRAPPTPVAHEAPAVPVPESLPMIGEDGVDEDGWPLNTADAKGFAALLHAGRYDDLTRYMEKLQADFEADPLKERWLDDALWAFRTADQRLDPLLDQWVGAHPDSFAPYLARGAHLTTLGYFYRGAKVSRETSGQRFEAMKTAHDRAMPDLEKAVHLRPKLVAAYSQMMDVSRGRGEHQAFEGTLARALEVCPQCMGVRETYLYGARPIWGGSLEAMTKVVTEAQRYADQNPRLKRLQGYPDWERCLALYFQKQYPEALTACNAALQHGQHWQFLAARGDVYLRQHNYEAAFNDLDLATKLNPSSARRYRRRARGHFALKRYVGAGRDLVTALQLDPADVEEEFMVHTARGIVLEANDDMYGGQTAKALELFELAVRLDEDNQWANKMLRNLRRAPNDEQLAAAEKHLAENPDDFDAHVKLDRVLSKRGAFKLAVELWDGFIEKRQDEPRAYLERGGSHFYLGELDAAEQDLQRACEMGQKQGCGFLQEVRSTRAQRTRTGGR